jgi:nucleoside-diphosphate-sugar epimerase
MAPISMETVGQRMAGQRVMLVGGAGFIGHNLALQLRKLGVETMVVDNLVVNNLIDNEYASERLPMFRTLYLDFLLDRFSMMRDAGVKLRNVDARNSIDLSHVFREFNPTKVVHLAAIASAVDARHNPGLAFDLQLTTLRNVLELVRHARDSVNEVMFLSSSTVYGDFETDTVDESVRPRPRGIYANVKYMGERLVRTYADQYGLGINIVRPSALYGERCISGRVSQKFIENALTGKPLLLEGGGDGRLDFTYIEDLVEGMVRAQAMHEGAGKTNTFNLTFGNARTIADLAAVLRDVIPDAKVEERPRAADKPIRGTLSTKRAEEVLGFKAQWTLEKGYRRYCEWYVEQWRRAQRNTSGH